MFIFCVVTIYCICIILTPSCLVYGELRRYPIEIDVNVRLISFWTKLCCGKESKLLAIMYKFGFQMSVVDRCSFLWLNKISNILTFPL